MIVLSQMLWEALLDEFRWPRADVERVAYIDGVGCAELSVATTLTFPNAELHPRYFTVSADAMSEAGQHFRRFGLERLAQVHTHPGRNVDHSEFDDENAYSQMNGAISIVLPHYARYRPELKDCGVHLRDERGWARLGTSEIQQLILVVPGCLDFRRYHDGNR